MCLCVCLCWQTRTPQIIFNHFIACKHMCGLYGLLHPYSVLLPMHIRLKIKQNEKKNLRLANEIDNNSGLCTRFTWSHKTIINKYIKCEQRNNLWAVEKKGHGMVWYGTAVWFQISISQTFKITSTTYTPIACDYYIFVCFYLFFFSLYIIFFTSLDILFLSAWFGSYIWMDGVCVSVHRIVFLFMSILWETIKMKLKRNEIVSRTLYTNRFG